MTDAPTDAPPLNGQHIGEAERAIRALLHEILEDAGISFLTWVGLNGVATGGDRVAREPLIARLADALVTDESSVRSVFDELESADLLRRIADVTAGDQEPGGPATVVELTPAGRALHQQVQRHIVGVTSRLYDGFAADDLAIARRVLIDVTQRARALRRRTAVADGR